MSITVDEAVQSGNFQHFWQAMETHPEFSGFVEHYNASTDAEWKSDAIEAVKKSFMAENMEIAGGGFSMENIMEAVGMIFKGEIKAGISHLMDSFNGAADPAQIAPLDQARDAALAEAATHDPNSGLESIVAKIDGIKPG